MMAFLHLYFTSNKLYKELKSKKLHFLLLIMVSTVFASFSQENQEAVPEINNTYLTVNGFTLLGVRHPRFRMGYIKQLSERFSLGTDVGIGNASMMSFITGSSNFDEFSYFEIRPQLFYFNKNGGKGSGISYISAEIFYTDFQNSDDFGYWKQDQDYFSYDDADYRQKEIGLNIIWGVFTNRKKALGLNLYVGAGLGLVENSFTKVENLTLLEEEPVIDFFLFDTPEIPKVGTHLFISFTAGVKIDLRLKKSS